MLSEELEYKIEYYIKTLDLECADQEEAEFALEVVKSMVLEDFNCCGKYINFSEFTEKLTKARDYAIDCMFKYHAMKQF